MDVTTLTFSDILKRYQNKSIEELVGKCIKVTGGRLCGMLPVPIIKELDLDANEYKQAVAIHSQPDSKYKSQFDDVAVNSEIIIVGVLKEFDKSAGDNIYVKLVDCYLES